MRGVSLIFGSLSCSIFQLTVVCSQPALAQTSGVDSNGNPATPHVLPSKNVARKKNSGVSQGQQPAQAVQPMQLAEPEDRDLPASIQTLAPGPVPPPPGTTPGTILEAPVPPPGAPREPPEYGRNLNARSISEANTDGWAHKRFEFLLTPFGLGPHGTLDHAISAGIYIQEHMAIVLEGALLTNFGDDAHDNLKASSFGISVKQFTGRSFYLRGGLNYQNAKLTNSHSDIFSDASRETDIFGVTFAIGNQWQIRNFTIGCQWLGTNIPIARRDVSEQGDISDSYATNPEFEFLRFFLGFSF